MLLYQAVSEAAERGRRGEGATLIEALTYRFRPHSLADDTTKYRTKDEESDWEPRDPLTRMRIFLTKKGLWSEEEEARVKEEAKATVAEHIKKAEETEKMTVAGLIDTMFEVTPSHLEEQKEFNKRLKQNKIMLTSVLTKTLGGTIVMAQMTMIQAIKDAMRVELERDPNVILFGEDVGNVGGVFRATEGLQKEFGEERVFDTPLAESAIGGLAVGLRRSRLPPNC